MPPEFVHRFVRGRTADGRVLLLLQGTGGDETDLLPLGEALAPGAALLSPRGKVLEHGRPRFFRRLAEGVFDVQDLTVRTRELAAFVRAAAAEYGFDPAAVFVDGAARATSPPSARSWSATSWSRTPPSGPITADARGIGSTRGTAHARSDRVMNSIVVTACSAWTPRPC